MQKLVYVVVYVSDYIVSHCVFHTALRVGNVGSVSYMYIVLRVGKSGKRGPNQKQETQIWGTLRPSESESEVDTRACSWGWDPAPFRPTDK